tara:strand:- start:1003 stop:1485 length:483 start_codon:yes stop_codon:yes gene_type:complete
MDTNKQKIYKKYMSVLSKMFLASYESKGLKASGQWGESLEVFSEDDTVGVKAEYNSSFMMEKGRKAGSYSNINALKEWIKTKQGLPQVFKSNPDKFAFIIARKHFLEGVKVPNKHNKGGVISEPIEEFTRKHLPLMFDELGEDYLDLMRTEFSSALLTQQ